MVCKMVNYHKGYKMEFLFNCQLFFRGGTQINSIVLAFFPLDVFIHIKKPGRYLLSEFNIKAINVKCKFMMPLFCFILYLCLIFTRKEKKSKHILLIPIQNLQLY